jgi:hypothetical protein
MAAAACPTGREAAWLASEATAATTETAAVATEAAAVAQQAMSEMCWYVAGGMHETSFFRYQ